MYLWHTLHSLWGVFTFIGCGGYIISAVFTFFEPGGYIIFPVFTVFDCGGYIVGTVLTNYWVTVWW